VRRSILRRQIKFPDVFGKINIWRRRWHVVSHSFVLWVKKAVNKEVAIAMAAANFRFFCSVYFRRLSVAAPFLSLLLVYGTFYFRSDVTFSPSLFTFKQRLKKHLFRY